MILAAVPEELGAVVEGVFSDRVDLARRFAHHLQTSAAERGLIGPREAARVWERHILNCAMVGELIAPRAHVIDVGSGAGLPGVVVALARPDLSVTLVEPLLRRATWLEEVLQDLGIDGVRVVRARAEDLQGRVTADAATARAVAALPVLAAWCLPLVAEGGWLYAIKGESAASELEQSRPDLVALGARRIELRVVGEDVLATPTRVVAVESGARAADHTLAAGSRGEEGRRARSERPRPRRRSV
jgi:16S rRNA (guanine527-N7)-methyltransferase